jgi:very-short-patch-repair endonuclease
MPGRRPAAFSRVEMVNSIAAAQDGLITRQQLLEVGFSTHSVERRRQNGMLICLHAGVYKVGPVAGPLVRERAALLACGGGVVSHVAAAVMWQLLPASRAADVIDVTLPLSRHARRRKGIRAHRRTLSDAEITSINGLPVTTAGRTLFDLAALTTRELDRALAGGEHRFPTIRHDLLMLLERYPAAKGTRALRALVLDPGAGSFTRSEAEDQFLTLIKSAGLARPETNVRVSGYEVDFYWRRASLVVEVDGYEYHGSKRAFVRDRQRDSALAAAGIRVIRISWHQLSEERDRTLVQLALALAKAGV